MIKNSFAFETNTARSSNKVKKPSNTLLGFKISNE
ncbi:MAG: hypothetical protein ACJA1Z_001966 [Patiriisocius sp.]|jgi:hypothetical protein